MLSRNVFLIKALLPGAFALLGTTSDAQSFRRVQIGLLADVHMLHTWTGKVDYYVNGSPVILNHLRPIGGRIGVTSSLNVSPRWTVLSSVSHSKDRIRDITETTYGGTHSVSEVIMTYSWMELSSGVFYKPVRRSSFSVLTGTGFNARRLLDATRTRVQPNPAPAVDESSWIYNWYYFIPFQAGMEFPIGGKRKLIWLLGYQWGLRYSYKPPPPPTPGGAVVCDCINYKMKSTTMSVSYFF